MMPDPRIKFHVSLSIQNAAQSDIYTNCRAAQASGGIGALDQTGQRQLRHVSNIAVTKVTAQRDYCGIQPMSALPPKADMVRCN